MWELNDSDLRLWPTWSPAHLFRLGAGWARCSCFAWEARGTLYGQRGRQSERGAGGVPSSSCRVRSTVAEAFEKHRPGARVHAGPTPEALPSRSWPLESGPATQAVRPVLPAPPQAHAAAPGLVTPAPSRWSHIRRGWLLRAFTHRLAREAWLALKPLREEARDSLLRCPFSRLWPPR